MRILLHHIGIFSPLHKGFPDPISSTASRPFSVNSKVTFNKLKAPSLQRATKFYLWKQQLSLIIERKTLKERNIKNTKKIKKQTTSEAMEATETGKNIDANWPLFISSMKS